MRFGFQAGAGEYEWANPHEPGCPAQQEDPLEADHNARLEAEIDTNHNAGLEAKIEDPLEEEAPMVPPLLEQIINMLGLSLVFPVYV